MESRIFILAAWLTGLSASAAPPEIGQVMDPTRGGETILLSGEGFDEKTVFRMWVPEAACDKGRERRLYASWGEPPELPREPPRRAFDLKVLHLAEQYAALEMPTKLSGYRKPFRGPYFAVLWAGNGDGWGMPYVLNRARLFFALPYRYCPDKAARLFGRNLRWYEETGGASREHVGCLRAWKAEEMDKPPARAPGPWGLVAMRKKGSQGTIILPRREEPWSAERHVEDYKIWVSVPEGIAEGEYQVRAHSGSGGEYGWSNPITFNVRKPEKWPTKVFKAKDFGLESNAGDQTEALNKALDAARQNGGGEVWLPVGLFIIKGTIQVPPKTVLIGDGPFRTVLRSAPDPKPNSAMIELQGPCRMEGLVVELPGQVPRGAGVKLNGPGIVIHNCSFRTEHFLTWGQGPLPNTILGDLVDGEITSCSFQGISHCFLPRTERSLIARNHASAWHFLTGGGGGPGLGWGTKHSVFEGNHINAPRGSCSGAHIHGRIQNFYIDNEVRRTLTCDGEAYLLEECGMRWYARPGEARFTRDSVTIPGASWKATTEKEPGLADHTAVITEGRGVGQYRLIVSSTADSVTLAEPWRIVPDASSACIVMAGSFEENLIGNVARDCNGCPPGFFYAGAVGCIVDSQFARNTGSPYLWSTFRNAAKPSGAVPGKEKNSSAWDYYLKPDYFNQFIRSTWEDTAGLYLTARPYGADSQGDIAGIKQLGTRVSRCVLAGSNGRPQNDDPRLAGTAAAYVEGPVSLICIENSTLSGFDYGVRVDAAARDVLLLRNRLLDLGQHVLDPAHRAKP